MDADLRRAAERAGDKYGEDFLGSYLSAPEDRRLSMLEGRFDSQEDLDGFLSDVELLENKEVSMGKMRAAANRKIVELIADTRRKNEEETANLEKEFQKIDAFEENGKRAVIEAFLDKYGGRDEVVFVSGAEELEGIFSPEEADEIMSDIRRKGAYDHKNGKIYLFEPHFKDGVEAFRTLAHERLHWIADKIRQDPSFNGMLNRVLQIMGGGNALRQSLESEYANNNDLDLAEEYIARVCERVALKEVLDENGRSVFKTFKNWIKRIFTAENTAIDIHDREITDIAKALFNRVNRETQKLYSDAWTATTPEENGPEVGGKYAVLDASEIIASTDGGYDDTLQPRNRARRGSIEQVSKIAAHLNPKRLDSSETTDEGAPIIDAKGQVLSGNGRILAIREAYENNPERGASYRDYVLSRARQMGLNVPSGIKSPVLVRRIENSGGMSLQEFAARSNKQKVASMSNAETAVADARRFLEIGTGGGRILDLFFPSDKGDVLSESNTEFINAFLEAVGGREQYIDKNGRIKANLAPRIRAAVLAAMLDPNKRDVIENLLDNPEGWSGLIRGLIGSAANLGKLAGNADYDLSSEMSQAVELYVNLRREGRTYKDYTSQLEMFEPAPSAEVSFLMELFEANVKTPTGISGVLNEYYSLVKNIDTSSVDMFGEGNPPKIAELQKAFERYGGTEHKSDVSWNIRKSDAERFASELQDYIDGRLDNKHVFRLGTTPEVMRLVGAKDLPLELAASVLQKKEIKHVLNLEDLKNLPVELADPIAIFQSETVPNGIVILTELPSTYGNSIVVAIHLNKQFGKAEVNSIRSIYDKKNSSISSFSNKGDILYLNTKKKPSWLKAPVLQLRGQLYNQNGFNKNKIFTEADLSQAEKDNIFELRGENSRFRYSVRGMRGAPTDAEIAEAERQVEEVRAKYVNTPQWLKAPNGKSTKLTERQWLQVRTQNFKKWFGDWDKKAWAEEAIKFLENTPAVARLTGKEFQKDGVKLTEKVPEYFKSIGGIAHNAELGDVVLDLKGVQDSLGHGISGLKASAFMAVKDVIEKGFIFNRETNWKNRKWNSAVIVAPIKIGNDDYVCEVVVAQKPQGNKFYLHEVEIRKTIENLFKTEPKYPANSQSSKLIIGKHIAEVKGKVSKVVDENSEPLVVYHGTDNGDFTVFDRNKSRNLQYAKGFFFSSDMNVAKSFGGRIISAFLNARVDYREAKKSGKEKDFMHPASDNRDIYIVFDSAQIKSATDNVGTYSENPDIRFSLADDGDGKKKNVSFEGGNTLKRREVITRDEEGKIIPPSERYDKANNNWNFSLLHPKDIDAEVGKNIKNIMTKIAYIRDNNLPTDMESIKKICDDNLKPVAKLNSKWFKRYKENFNAKSPYVYSSEAYLVEHHFRRHSNTEISRYLLLPNTIYDPQNVKDTTDKYGASQTFIRKYDKWVSSTIKPYADVDENGRIVMFKNFYKSKHKDMPYKNKPDIDNSTSGSSINSNEEDASPSIANVSKRNDPSRRVQKISGVSSDKEHLLGESSENNSENQDNNTSKYDFSLADEETSEKERKILEKQNEARAQISSKAGWAIQATIDSFAPLATLERVLYGKIRGAEKSAWKMALMTKNLDQVIFHVLRVGGITYNKATGEMKHRNGAMSLEKILNRVRGKNYKNFEHYAQAKIEDILITNKIEQLKAEGKIAEAKELEHEREIKRTLAGLEGVSDENKKTPCQNNAPN